MPWFRFIDEAKVTLRYRNGDVELTFANLTGPDGWAWVADSKKPGKPPIVLVRASSVAGLQSSLRILGFPVEAGTPAEKIMRAAVKCGYAEELPEDEASRDELRRTRALARLAATSRSVYQLAKNFPRELEFRDGTARLEFARGECDNEWIFRARKTVPPEFEQIASSRYGRLALETILRQGVVVRENSAAARLLDHLVAAGYATKRIATRADLR